MSTFRIHKIPPDDVFFLGAFKLNEITQMKLLFFFSRSKSKYLSREDVMLDEEGRWLAVGGQHHSKEANTYGGSTIVGHMCPFPICGVPITSDVFGGSRQ